MDIPVNLKNKNRVIRAWRAGVESVAGEAVTREALAQDSAEPITHLLAVGKAAAAMCRGALPSMTPDARALVVTKHGHGDEALEKDARVRLIEAGHPVPDERSMAAGDALIAFVRAVPADGELVMLVSGGASALVESLPHSLGLPRLQAMTSQMLADGYTITQMNAARTGLSRIKGGKLLAGCGGRSVRVYAISDVPGDNIAAIGSGIGSRTPDTGALEKLPDELREMVREAGPMDDVVPPSPAFDYSLRIVGSNRIARDAAADWLTGQGIEIAANEECLHQDVYSAAADIGAMLKTGPRGAYVLGGEPTVILPPTPGRGGRNQCLALALAREIRGLRGVQVIVAGTDGSDGPTAAAGGLVDGDTFNAASGAEKALLNADSGTYLARIAALFSPGPTGTNVMDLVIALKA